VRGLATTAAAGAALVLLAACSSGSNGSSSASSATAGGAGSSAAAGSTSASMSPSMSMSMSGMPSDMGSSSASAATPATGDSVDIKNFSFEPASLTIKAGTTVTWHFEDSAAHTVKAADGSFTSPALSGGKTYTHKFTTPGKYPYICSIHQYMTGTIIVSS
jgi:plastocyanin